MQCFGDGVVSRKISIANRLRYQHGTADHVAGSKDVRRARAQVPVDLNEAARIDSHAGRLNVQALGVGDPSDASNHQCGVDHPAVVERRPYAVRNRIDTDRGAAIFKNIDAVIAKRPRIDDAMVRLQEDVTQRIQSDGAKGLVIDVSGVEFLDSFMTKNLRDLALTARLMGVTAVVSGLRPAVAMTLIEMGLEIPGVKTTLNLERALEALFAAQQEEARALGEGEGEGDHG